jgi:hypothetical protein
MNAVGKPTLIRLPEPQRAQLDALAAQSGNSVAALIRWCLDRSLPTLAGNIARNTVPNESTIDTNSKA